MKKWLRVSIAILLYACAVSLIEQEFWKEILIMILVILGASIQNDRDIINEEDIIERGYE